MPLRLLQSPPRWALLRQLPRLRQPQEHLPPPKRMRKRSWTWRKDSSARRRSRIPRPDCGQRCPQRPDGLAGIVQAALDRAGGTTHRSGNVANAHFVIIIENDGGLLLIGEGIDKAADDLLRSLLIQDPVRGIRIQGHRLKGEVLIIERECLFLGFGAPDFVQADVGDDLVQPRGDSLGTLQPVQIHIGLFIGLLNEAEESPARILLTILASS